MNISGMMMLGVGVGLLVHLICIIGTLGMAAEKNRKPLLWLPFAFFLSPLTLLLILFIDYAPRHHHT